MILMCRVVGHTMRGDETLLELYDPVSKAHYTQPGSFMHHIGDWVEVQVAAP